MSLSLGTFRRTLVFSNDFSHRHLCQNPPALSRWSFNFHPNYLSNLLKKGTGKSFKDLLQLQKINKAAMILMKYDLPIPKVVEEVGYSSVTFFYKKFKEIFHMTPYEIRKNNNFQ